MKQCPTCKRETKDHLFFCPYDGQALVPKVEQDPLLGTVLDGKYRLDERIGEGGMGKVYRATHIHIDQIFAVKILHPHLSSDQMALARFRKEARAAARIRHPNAVAITDFGVTRDSGTAYLVMELLEGVDLRDRLQKQKYLSCEEAFVIAYQTCAALHVAHANGLVHRDLKPDNIWILKTRDGGEQVKVFDFGIAKLKTSSDTNKLTLQGMLVGTPYYMSPEQCRSEEELDARSDIYSLGVILYEMLTGLVPFRGPSPWNVISKHNSEPPQPLRELRAEIPIEVQGVVLRALSKSPDARQQSAAQLAQELELALYNAGLKPRAMGVNTPQTPFPNDISSPYRLNTPSTPVEFSSRPDIDHSLPPQPPGVAPAAQAWPPPADHSMPPATTIKAAVPTAEPHARLFGQTVVGGMQGIAPTPPSDTGNFAVGRMTWTRLATLAEKNRQAVILGAACIVAVIAGIIIIKIASGHKPPEKAKAAKPTPPPGMVYVEGGEFKMGSNDPNSYPNSRPEIGPLHVDAFFLDQTEVTNKQYYEFVKAGHKPPPHWRNGIYPPGEASLPVYNISWQDAHEYAQSVGKRLPHESEWEYAARGQENRVAMWEGGWSANRANLRESGKGKPVPAGSYGQAGASWCGAEDLLGNVAEWVEEAFVPYKKGVGLPDPNAHIARGGACNNSKDELLTVNRQLVYDLAKPSYIGFRCAQDLPQERPR